MTLQVSLLADLNAIGSGDERDAELRALTVAAVPKNVRVLERLLFQRTGTYTTAGLPMLENKFGKFLGVPLKAGYLRIVDGIRRQVAPRVLKRWPDL